MRTSLKAFENREEVYQYFIDTCKLPIRSCDFVLYILQEGVEDYILPVTSYNYPDSGITYNMDNSAYGHVGLAQSFSPMSISFLWRNGADSAIHKIWSNQFNGGIPVFVPLSERPNVYLYMINDSESVQLMELNGCIFSNPIPSIAVNSDGICTFTTNINYNSIKLF